MSDYIFTGDKVLDKKLYRAFRRMHRSCYNETNCTYPNVGGNGIEVCNEWYENFYEFCKWSTEVGGFGEGLTLLRKDKSKDFTPDNCCWDTVGAQQSHKTNNVFVEVNGQRKVVYQWSKELNMDHSIIRKRLNRGESDETSIERRNRPVYVEYQGKTMTLRELAGEIGIKVSTMYLRYNRHGLDMEKLTAPLRVQ